LQQKQQNDMEEMQLRLAIAQGDQDMKERIETARLTRDAAKLKHEQDKTVIDLSTKQGAPNVYQ
jgi:galactose mutarotase-like enzyme